MSDLNNDFPSACRRQQQQQQSVVSLLLHLLYKHVSGVKKRLHELCLTFQTSIHPPDSNCGLDGASMRHQCAARVYTSIMQYKKWAGQQSSQLGDKISQLYVCLQKDTLPCVCVRESFFHRRVWAPLVVPQLYAGYESIDWNDQVQKEMWGLLMITFVFKTLWRMFKAAFPDDPRNTQCELQNIIKEALGVVACYYFI